MFGPNELILLAGNETAVARKAESVSKRESPKPPFDSGVDRFHWSSAKAAATKVLKSRDPMVREPSEEDSKFAYHREKEKGCTC